MNQCEETEEGVHPSETPLCGQHDNQTKAQRLGSLESLSSDLKKDSFRSSDRRISLGRKVSSKYRCVSNKRRKTFNHTAFKKNPDHKCAFKTASAPLRLDFSESLFSHLLKDVATADRYSVLSSDSGISLGRKVSSKYRRVSSKRTKTFNRTAFKKNPDHKCAFKTASLPTGLYSSELKDVATADRYSVLSLDSGLDSLESLSSDLKNIAISDDSSDSRISLGRKVSSKYRRVSSKRTKTFNHTAFKKKK